MSVWEQVSNTVGGGVAFETWRLRVPEGWLYTTVLHSRNGVSTVFVPDRPGVAHLPIGPR